MRFLAVGGVGAALLLVGLTFGGRPWGIGAGLRVVGGLGALSVAIALVIIVILVIVGLSLSLLLSLLLLLLVM